MFIEFQKFDKIDKLTVASIFNESWSFSDTSWFFLFTNLQR